MFFSRAGLTLCFFVLSASATRHHISCPNQDKKGKHLQFAASEVIEFNGKFSCEYAGGAGKCLYNAENPHSLSSGSNDCPVIKSDKHGVFHDVIQDIFHHRKSSTSSKPKSTSHSSTSTKHSSTTSKATSTTHSSTSSKATSTTHSQKHHKNKHHKSKTSTTSTSSSSASKSSSTSSHKSKHHKTHKFTKSRTTSKPTSTSHSSTTTHLSLTTSNGVTITIKPTYSTSVPGIRIAGGVSTINFGSASPSPTSPFAKNIKFSSKAGNSTSSAASSRSKSALWVLVPAAGLALMAV